jgi:YceI-like domain
MSNMKFSPLGTAVLAVALSLGAVSAQALDTAPPQGITLVFDDASLEVRGDSTLHKWTLKAATVDLKAALDPASAPLRDRLSKGGLKGLTLSLPVKGLKSDEGRGMDKNTLAALDSDKFPAISFVMGPYALKGPAVLAHGTLSIHGVSKDVALPGTITAQAQALELKGSYDLLMSDYGIKPPVMMLGTVRVADKVTIVYDFVMRPAP